MNKVELIGRTTDNIECKYTQQTQKAVAKFRLAVNREGKDNGADFINCTVWGKTAENMARHVRKGDRVGIVGRIQTGSYEKDGRKVYTTDVIVERLEFLETKEKNQGFHDTGMTASDKPFEDSEQMDFATPDADLPF